MRSSLHQYKYQDLRLSSTGSNSGSRSTKWKAVLVSLAMVFSIGLIFAFYSSYDPTPFERKLISRWDEKKTQILKRGAAKNQNANDDGILSVREQENADTVLQRLPLSSSQRNQKFDPFALSFLPKDLDKRTKLKVNESDIIVNLHIQKTGGSTFGRHLVRHLQVDPPCVCRKKVKRCDCRRPDKENQVWLFSRFSVGWRCGLHADWTELVNCVPSFLDKYERQHHERRYFFVTMLRDPVQRYLSEFRHVQRGATWKKSSLRCNGRAATEEEVPFCFDGDDWANVTLPEFLSCPSNLANNRQTRMLANLTKVDCYDTSHKTQESRNAIMLQSAKDNLKDFAFFGLTEFQKESQELFEWTFDGIRFSQSFTQKTSSHASETQVSPDQMAHIVALNGLDVDLYNYARSLFSQRVEFMRAHPLPESSKTRPIKWEEEEFPMNKPFQPDDFRDEQSEVTPES